MITVRRPLAQWYAPDMRRLLLAALTVAAIGCTEKSSPSPAKETTAEADLPEISVAEVAAGLEAKTLAVVDCNSEKTRKKVGVLPGAILVDDEEAYAASVLPADKAAKLVFYCGGPG